MRKTIITFITVFCVGSLVLAQDIIVVQGNVEINAKIISVSSDGVEYRLYDVEDSPLYRLRLQEIISLTYASGRIEDLSIFLPQAEETAEMQEIMYFRRRNAFYMDDRRLSSSEVRHILLSNPMAISAFDAGERALRIYENRKTTSRILLGCGVGGMLMFRFGNSMDTRFIGFLAGYTLLPAGLVMTMTVPATRERYKFHFNNAVDIHNRSLPQNTVSLHIGVTENGLGFIMRF